MRHFTDEELTELYYSEDVDKAEAKLHFQECSRCARAYDELGKLLDNVRTPEPPARDAEYGARVWQSIRNSVRTYQPKSQPNSQPSGKPSYLRWPHLAYAAACLLLLAVAFLTGRLWERAHTTRSLAAVPQQAKERVVLFVLDNHLDRSERLLVQLNHAGTEDDEADLPLRAEARQLLSDNRLYRQSAEQANDPLLAAALDHLQRVLLEIANSPGDLNSKDIARIEQEMNTQGLLFQIRVLRTKVSGQETRTPETQKGATL